MKAKFILGIEFGYPTAEIEVAVVVTKDAEGMTVIQLPPGYEPGEPIDAEGRIAVCDDFLFTL